MLRLAHFAYGRRAALSSCNEALSPNSLHEPLAVDGLVRVPRPGFNSTAPTL